MKKWQDIAIKGCLFVVSQLFMWALWVTSTLFDLRSDVKMLLLKEKLTVADAELVAPRAKQPTLNAEISLPFKRFLTKEK